MRPGGLFVAHVAPRDGHDFVASAFANGARATLVSRVPQNLLAAVAAGGGRRAGLPPRRGPA